MLTALLDNRTFPTVAAGLAEGNQRTVAGVAVALELAQLRRPLRPARQPGDAEGHGRRHPRGAEDAAQRTRLRGSAYSRAGRKGRDVQDRRGDRRPEHRARAAEPARGQGPGGAHAHHQHPGVVNQPEVAQALAGQLKDTNACARPCSTRSPAWANVDVGLLCEVLRDLGRRDAAEGHRCRRAREPSRHDPLPDRHPARRAGEPRRAAVEVLNEIGTPAHIKHLPQSIKDDDWGCAPWPWTPWPRSRGHA